MQKYGLEQQFSPITSVTLNSNNQVLATSNQRGIVNLYRTEQFFDPLDGTRPDQVLNITDCQQIQSESNFSGAVNQAQFSHLMKEMLGTVTDHGTVCLYNVNTKQLVGQFSKHSGYVKGLSFSPLNKLLMCSVGLDRQIIFYDIHEKLVVKKIVAPFPIKSVNFSSDGHTLAVGSSMNGQNQQCLVYDLRKSSSVTLPLIGHQSAVNCIRFTQKFDSKSHGSSQVGPAVTAQQPSGKNQKQRDLKTIEQIRDEAKKNV